MVLGSLLVSSLTPASGQALSTQPFTAYGSGDAIGLTATGLVGARVATSGGSVNSGPAGLTAPVSNELGLLIQPSTPDKNAFGLGTAIAVPIPPAVTPQVVLTGLARAFAPPPSPLVLATTTIPLNTLLYADTARGEAQATFDPLFCPIGRPLSFGRGYVENLELAGTMQAADGSIQDPLVGLSSPTGTPRATTQSRTVTFLTSNGDGTFGVVSETRQTVAPIAIAGTPITIEIAGEFGFRVAATGKPGGASAGYTGNPLITIKLAGVDLFPPVTLQSITGPTGITTPPVLAALASLSLGAPPRALRGAVGTTATLAADGTSASGAVDLLRLTLLSNLVDLSVAHMEGAVTVPAGGIRCQIPVSKVSSVDPVTVGSDFAFTISIPNDAAFFSSLFNCDLINISAVDRVETASGSPRIQLLSASNGGVVSGNTVTFANLGNYTLGQPPILVTINARIPANSGAGVLRDTVNVSATLGNCRGTGAAGEDIIGSAQINGNAITGAFTLVGPNVTRGDLAATGGNSWPLVAGGGFLLAALGLVRLRRRAAEIPAQG